MHEFCTYASDSYEARLLAMELVNYVHEHPHSVDYIRCEDNVLVKV